MVVVVVVAVGISYNTGVRDLLAENIPQGYRYHDYFMQQRYHPTYLQRSLPAARLFILLFVIVAVRSRALSSPVRPCHGSDTDASPLCGVGDRFLVLSQGRVKHAGGSKRAG